MLRLVWAVDPFGDPGVLAAAAKSAAALGRLGPVEVVPVFALPPWVRPSAPLEPHEFGGAGISPGMSSEEVARSFAGPVWPGDPGVVSRILVEAREQFEHVLSRLKGDLYRTLLEEGAAKNARRGLQIRPLEILAPAGDSPEGAGLSFQADAVSDFARRQHAMSVLVCTHARQRPRPKAETHRFAAPLRRIPQRLGEWVIGSFAETLIERSKVPVISVQPAASVSGIPPLIREMLFATDFSAESQLAFGPALRFARELGLPLVLYHCLEPPTPILDYAYSPYLLYANERRQEHAHIQAASWVARAAREGVKAQARFEEESVSVPESLARAAEERSSLIAVAARSNPAAAVLLGSVTRKLVRIATSPLWVLHVDRRVARAEKLRQTAPKKRAA